MDAEFWHERWAKNKLGFHEKDGNNLFVRNFAQFGLKNGAHLFLPLCGKTRDIGWLLAKGYRVSGAELNQVAVEQLFSDLGVVATITPMGSLNRYSYEDITIFQGDIFHVTQEMLGDVDAIYDRAALVALPLMMRLRYSAHLREITHNVRQMLVVYTYDQNQTDGPPFSINEDEIHRHYQDHYQITKLEGDLSENCIRGQVKAEESIWLLKP